MKTNYIFTKNNINFSLKNATKEFSLIRMRMTINGVRLSYCLPSEYKIRCEFWDKEFGMAIEDPKRNPALKGNVLLQNTLRNINKEIEKTTNATLRILENYRTRDIKPMADQLKEALLKELKGFDGKEKRTFKDLDSFIDYYITLCREGVILNPKGRILVAGTIRNYLSTKSVLKKYSSNRHIKLRFESITTDFYNDFIKYLNEATHARGKYKPNVIGKFIKNIKVFMRYSYENDFTFNDDFKKREFKAFKENVQTIYLTLDELEALYKLDLSDSQAQIRDSFLISCYTGLRYSDIARLETKHINFDTGIITIMTQKTDTQVVIPIHPIVEEILAKYGNKPPLVHCNQATNRMVKKLCRQAGITDLISVVETAGGVKQEKTYEKCELVTSHTARRSFATNTYKEGIPSLHIMQITGHTTESSFMRYIRISKEENATALQSHSFFAKKAR